MSEMYATNENYPLLGSINRNTDILNTTSYFFPVFGVPYFSYLELHITYLLSNYLIGVYIICIFQYGKTYV